MAMTNEHGALPLLPSGNGGMPSLFRRIVLAYLLTQQNEFGDIRISQRDLAAVFNRSGQNSVGRHLRKICSLAYVFRAERSIGVLPDTYWLGIRLADDTEEHAYFTQLSTALFGVNGLLTAVGRPEALGVGCLNESGSLVLGTLAVGGEEISVSTVIHYLNGLVSNRSVFRVLAVLEREGIVEKSSGVVRLSGCWKQQLGRFMAVTDECCPRKSRGDSRRQAEQQANLARLCKGLLTDAERTYLRSQKCVYCDAEGNQQQHFPPMRFLDSYEVVNNRHLVWPICGVCNGKEKNFIRSLPAMPSVELITVRCSDTAKFDLLALYRDESELGIHRFHGAHLTNDATAAHSEIVRCYTLWKCIEAFGATDETDRYDPCSEYIRCEDTLRVPMRRRRDEAQFEPGHAPRLTALVRLNGAIAEFSYGAIAPVKADLFRQGWSMTRP